MLGPEKTPTKPPAHRRSANQDKGPVTVDQLATVSPKVRKAAAKVASTKAGQEFIGWLMEICGYKYSSLTMTPEGVLLTDAIVHNETRRSVYLQVRRAIPGEYLNQIEKEPTDESKKSNT